MKRLWKKPIASRAPTRLEAVLGPSTVNVTAFGGWLGRATVHTRELAVPAAGEGEVPWRGALTVFDAALAERPVAGAAVSVAVSSQWIRFALVPRREELASAQERLEYARHVCVARFGAAAERWTLRLADAAGGATLACVADPELIEALRSACERAGAVLRRVQPVALAVFDEHERRLRRGRLWFVVAEPQAAFLALLDGGAWQSVAVRRTMDGAPESLARLLDAEHQLQGLEAPVAAVRAWAGAPADRPGTAGDYRFEWLGTASDKAEAKAA